MSLSNFPVNYFSIPVILLEFPIFSGYDATENTFISNIFSHFMICLHILFSDLRIFLRLVFRVLFQKTFSNSMDIKIFPILTKVLDFDFSFVRCILGFLSSPSCLWPLLTVFNLFITLDALQTIFDSLIS